MSPIKHLALKHQIPVFQPEKIGRKTAVETLKQWEADAYVVAAFGQLLPQAVLDLPRYGSINIHASLLPRWRGAAPIQAAIRAGDAETGVTIMKMDAGLDTGPMLLQGAIPLAEDETGQSLHDRLAALGADLLLQTLPGYFAGEILPQAQPEHGMTYAPRITKEEGQIDWTQEAIGIDRLVRAFDPWPGTFTHWNGKLLKILSGKAVDVVAGNEGTPGQVIAFNGEIGISTGSGVYFPSVVQLAGKKATPAADFGRGYPDFVGSVLK